VDAGVVKILVAKIIKNILNNILTLIKIYTIILV